MWADVIESVASEVEAETRSDNLNQMERIASRMAKLEASAEQKFLPLLRELHWVKDSVGLLSPPERAAWLGLLNPYSEGLKRPLDALRNARFRIGEALSRIASAHTAIGESDLDAMLDRKAVELYQVVAEEELKLPCIRTKQAAGGEAYEVLVVKVPAGVSRPHRVYHEAIDRIHQRVYRLHPEYAGRVGFAFERSQDAA